MKKLILYILVGFSICNIAYAEETLTFKCQQSFTRSQIDGFAQFNGYKTEVPNPDYKVFPKTIPNPEYDQSSHPFMLNPAHETDPNAPLFIQNPDYVSRPSEIPNPDYVELPTMIPNPQSSEEFVKQKFIEHTLKFTTSWAEYLKNQAIQSELAPSQAGLESKYHDQIIEPIANVFTIDIEKS
jgi:hypothetical protein